MLSLLAEQAPQFDLYAFLQVTGTPGMMLAIYMVWWQTVGKAKAEKDEKIADAHQRTAILMGEVVSNLYRLHDKTEEKHENADHLLNRGERIVERLDERFPSGVINPPKTVGA